MQHELVGPLGHAHQWIDMSNQKIPVLNSDGTLDHFKRTCPPALGYSFAAGTTDGPGEFDFTQVILNY